MNMANFRSGEGINRILVFRGGALGDFILTLPAIAALRQRWPRAFIELVAHPQYAELAARAQLVDNVRSLDSASMAMFFQSESGLPQGEAEYLRSFDLIISCLHDLDDTVLSHLEKSGAKRIITEPISKLGFFDE